MLNDFLDRLTDSYENSERRAGFITFLNPYSYGVLRKMPEVVKEFDYVFIDGFLLCYIVGAYLKRKVCRVSFDFTSIAGDVFRSAASHQDSVFLIGAQNEEIEATVNVIRGMYPELNLVGFRHGYFDNSVQREKFISELNDIAPDLVVVGMGAGLQEQFLVDLKKAGWHGLGFTCGGFFHQTARGGKYYPDLINRFNLRWLYRIYDEPKLFKRYFFQYPACLVTLFFDMFTLKKS